MNKINIDVTGISGSGKTSIIMLIERTLRDAGFKNININSVDADYIHLSLTRDLDACIHSIAERAVIEITEHSARRSNINQ